MKSYAIPALIFALALLANGSAYTLPEGQQALITQFGRIVGQPVTQAGLHFKLPFIHDVRYFEKRILEWDGDSNQIPTKDKKFIWVDTTARWRIIDAVKFAQTVRTEDAAQTRLSSILDGSTRDVISNHNLVEAVRNTNTLLDQARKRAEALAAAEKAEPTAATIEMEEEITGELEVITVGRERLSDMIHSRAKEKLAELGIELIDAQLRRIAYEQSVEEKVYDRMISERKRIAEKIRSIGKGEQAKIRGKLNLDLKEIESKAYRESQEIKGRAEAEAINIYAKSLNQDPDFYEFTRTLDAYRKTLKDKGSFVISTDSDFLRLMQQKR
ncbi:protease modulator HflC [Oligoflexus tunisiensis]|uniref:protease modulator HflC n=1 Tax=Oligoflexus tunisiensis TaxID=708132 RepID=UPI001C401BEF|nr:protease modulator HflC [Oligoflexus tunisiensis]